MPEHYSKARFWKCALQVNPAGYIAYRGADHGMTEEQYNRELLRIAKENDIKVIGLANHGNVDDVDTIRTLMNENDILVFPGFDDNLLSSEQQVERMMQLISKINIRNSKDFPTQIFVKER